MAVLAEASVTLDPNVDVENGNLVLNGNMKYGRVNLPSNVTYDTQKNGNSFGSFYQTGQVGWESPEFIPVDVNRKYGISMDVKASRAGAKKYLYFACYDRDKYRILPSYIMYNANSTTTLAKPLNNGDTVVYLTSTAGFDDTATQTYRLGFIFWNYKDSTGYQYPTHSYSRNVCHDLYANTGINKSNNTITLKAAWNKGAVPQGTSVSQCNNGSVYSYFGSSIPYNMTTSWETQSTRVSGTSNDGVDLRSYEFPPGTAFIRLGAINHNDTTASDKVWYTNLTVRDITDADAIDSLLDAQGALSTRLETYITQNADTLRLASSAKYYTDAEVKRLAAEKISELKINPNEITAMITQQINAEVNGADGANTKLKEIGSYWTLNSQGVFIGKTNNNIRMFLENNSLSFVPGSDTAHPLAKFTTNGLEINRGTFTSGLTLGNFGFIVETDGSLTFKKVK
ncbi:hypothetical protein [Ileibacterium valens]|uniref:hypothetical protein n=1 Tax=Ileibacterium valens TaxID=1862668 RepID=UPI002731A91C|nr:hypothetical protein [Ileibacterium valens]